MQIILDGLKFNIDMNIFSLYKYIQEVNMNFNVNSRYSSATNTAYLTISGSPETDDEIGLIMAEAQKSLFQPNTLTYLVTDLTNVDLANIEIINKFQRGIGPIVSKNVAFSVVVASSSKSESVSRIFNIFSGRHLPIVQSLEQAESLIAREQEKSGVHVQKK